MNIITRINHYFLSENPEEIAVSDYVYFYGFYIVSFAIAFYTILSVIL